MHSPCLIDSAHVRRCIWHTVLDHKTVHTAALLLLRIGIGLQSCTIEVRTEQQVGIINNPASDLPFCARVYSLKNASPIASLIGLAYANLWLPVPGTARWLLVSL